MEDNTKTMNPETNNDVNDGQKSEEQKPTILQRIAGTYRTFKATKGGRWTIRVVKGVGLIGLGKLCWDGGAKSVKPTVVYVKEGVVEEEPKAEASDEAVVDEVNTEE